MNRAVQQTTRDLRRHNRSALLSHLYLHGPVSRQDLIRESGLSSATVSNVVSDLINDGVVAEAGLVGSDGGRPRTLIRVRGDFGHVAGVDIGETHIQIGLFDYTLGTITTETYPVAGAGLEPESVARLVVAGVGEVVSKVGLDPTDLLGVGVGVPGAVTAGGGELVYAPTLGWQATPLADMLRRDISVPLYVDNCARTLGKAEMWRGAGRGAARAVVALLGVGVGAAVTTAADPLRDATSLTSEWGHTVINVDGRPCRCGSRGCLEAYVGAKAILDDYLGLPGARPFETADTESRLAELVARATGPGPEAEILDRTAKYLGIGIANLINLLNPDIVVLSGWAGATLGPAILPAVRATVTRHALGYLQGQVRIRVGELGPEAVAMGAATLPVVRVLANGGFPLA
ncbi:ROK family transcriptional regulator [Planotetraspora sp. A-T 1434]|uniref:ROK family transcriptional regulator n=1 Tax=Planotetraspora sp. A-T 1434 TaxID=2979219 RepID=UPI0021C05A44|nr:ROK family transcriptional regulator [Planotetraspora sp. A-T 1434]MCT9934432.1 ROK family transcriptional regulator [Planotetraspora sp. A-T 1434]